MRKHYKSHKARKNPIQRSIDIFKRDGQNQVCNQKIHSLSFGQVSFRAEEPPIKTSKNGIKIFDLNHCAKYLDNITVFLEAAQEMLRLEGFNVDYVSVHFIQDGDKAIEDKIDIRDIGPLNDLNLYIRVYDLTIFTTKTNFMLFLMKIGLLLDRPDLPILFDTRYEKLDDYKRKVQTMRVGINKYITWVDKTSEINLSAETQQAVSDIELADSVLSDSRSSEDQIEIADAMKESAEETLATNALNHPENQEAVNAAIQNVPGEQLSLFASEAQQELEGIQQQNAQVQSSSASRQDKEESEELTEESADDTQKFLAAIRRRRQQGLGSGMRRRVAPQTPPPTQRQVQTPPPSPPTPPKPKGKEMFSFNQDNFQMSPAVRVGSGSNKNLEKIAKSLRNRLADFIDYESIDGVIHYNIVLGNKTSATVNGDTVTVTVAKTASIEDAIEALAYAVIPLYEENSFKFRMDGYLLTDTLIHVYDYAK